MQSKYAHAYMTGLQKNADLSGFLSGAGDVVKAAPGFLFHAVADPAAGMVRDNFRTMGNIGDAYGSFIRGDIEGVRSSMLKGVNSAGSALGNTALTGLNVVGAIGSLPFGEAPEAGLLALEGGIRSAATSPAARGAIARAFSAVKNPIVNTVSSIGKNTSKLIGPTATNSLQGAGQAFWPWLNQGFGGISQSPTGLSFLGRGIQGVTKATQPIANLAENLGLSGASSAYSNLGNTLARGSSLVLPKSYLKAPWYMGPTGFRVAQEAGNEASYMMNIKKIAPSLFDRIIKGLKGIGPVPLAAAGIGIAGGAGAGLYNSMHSPKKKDGDSDVIK